MNQWRIDVQSLAKIESCPVECLGLDARPKFELVSMATATEAAITAQRQVGDEVAWRVAAAERAVAADATAPALQSIKADQLEHLLHGDASAEGGVVDAGHDPLAVTARVRFLLGSR